MVLIFSESAFYPQDAAKVIIAVIAVKNRIFVISFNCMV